MRWLHYKPKKIILAAQTPRQVSFYNSADQTTTNLLIINMYHCNYCRNKFSNLKLLHQHEATHKKNYPCKVCHKHYPTRFSLFRHAKSAGHYLDKSAACSTPSSHHIPFKGRAVLTKGAEQFGRIHSWQPTERPRHVMNRKQIQALYQPRVSTRTIESPTSTLRSLQPEPSTSSSQSRVTAVPKIEKRKNAVRDGRPSKGKQPANHSPVKKKHTSKFEVISDDSLLDSSMEE